jgi:hypothetical protein
LTTLGAAIALTQIMPHTLFSDWVLAAAAAPVLGWVWREWALVHRAERATEALA